MSDDTPVVTEAYFDRIEEQVQAAYDVAEAARSQGKDPEPHVDVPIAEDLPEKAENLVCAALYPEMKDQGIKQRIRELEEEYGKKDERVALTIAREIAENQFYEFDELEDGVDAGIRVGLAYLTGGVVTAPLDGIADVRIRENDDDTRYLAVSYAGPIRSAGGTASALSVMLADYVRKEVGLAPYKTREEELERYAIEVEDYVMRVTKKQYTPARKETRMIAENVPIEVTGIPTEGDLEVSNKKDLERVETNGIRGGMCLVYLDGLPLKASKMLRRLKSFGEEFGLEHWYWLEDYLDLQKRLKAEDADASEDDEDEQDDEEDEEDGGKEPRRSAAYMENVVGGRPVLSHPGRFGGFRLRYGRSRSAGLAAISYHPATMVITDKFLAVGTQLKTEYPGKATVSMPCDTIDGPVVRLKNGDVRRINDVDTAEQVKPQVDEILFLGDVLVPYGEFLENGKKLLPAGYCEEWWAADMEDALHESSETVNTDLTPYTTTPFDTPPATLALSLAKKLDVPLHPAYTYHWQHINQDMFTQLCNQVHNENEAGDELHVNPDVKPVLEQLAVPHRVSDDTIIIENAHATVLTELLPPPRDIAADAEPADAIMDASGITLREKAPTFLGARMGRPEKVGKRQLKGSPQLLFPCGHRAGGRMRNLMETYEKGSVDAEICLHHCSTCDETVPFPVCPMCGNDTEKVFRCRECGEEVDAEEHCDRETTRRGKETIPVQQYVDAAADNLGINELPDLLKSPRGVTGRHRHVEPIEKGLLRQKYELYVNKDGTIRFDGTDLTLTHFKPCEVSTPVDTLRDLGYTHDIHGEPLEDEEQVLALKPQDIVLTDTPKGESGAQHLFKVANFVDDLLTGFYELDPFYEADTKQDLVGHHVIGLAPHTSGGIIGRIIGFTDAKGIYAHPYWHAAKRRNCLPGDTEVVTADGVRTLRELFADGENGRVVDTFGTEAVDSDRNVVSYNKETKEAEEKQVTAVYRAKAQDHVIDIETVSGRRLTVFPDHRVWTTDGVKRARHLEEDTDVVYTQRHCPASPSTGQTGEQLDLLEYVHGERVMARNCAEHIERVVAELGGLSAAAETVDLTMKQLSNYVYRESMPVTVLAALEDAAGVEPVQEMTLAAKRDSVEIPRFVDRAAFASLLGYYAAEGYSRKRETGGNEFYQVSLCFGEDALKHRMQHCITTVFDIEPHTADNELVISSRLVNQLFAAIGAGTEAGSKRVPDIVRNGRRDVKKRFLQTYFDGDGSVETGRLHVSCQSVSRTLIEDVGFLLQQFGVFYRIRESTREAGGILLDKYGEEHYAGRTVTSYTLHIRSEHAVTFGQEIGFTLPRKQDALTNVFDQVRTSRERGVADLVEDPIEEITVRRNTDQYMYDLEVADNHTFATRNGVTTHNCDGDEDSVLLLMDALLNFSRQFLPDYIGGRSMDAPLILASRLRPDEVDEESWNVDIIDQYPAAFYEATYEYPEPGDVEDLTRIAEDAIEEGEPFATGFTHDTTDIDGAPIQTTYVTFTDMTKKVRTQLALGERIQAVDEHDVAERILSGHFFSDLRGNLRAFSEQRFRCSDCNEMYRRVPLAGVCTNVINEEQCNGKLLLTVYEGTIRKYLAPSEEIADKYQISTYLRQQIRMVREKIQSLFGKAERQTNLMKFD